RLLIAGRRRAARGDGNKQVLFTVVADIDLTRLIGLVERLAEDGGLAFDLLPVTLAVTPTEAEVLVGGIGIATDLGHAHQRPGEALGGIPVVAGKTFGDGFRQLPGTVAVA